MTLSSHTSRLQETYSLRRGLEEQDSPTQNRRVAVFPYRGGRSDWSKRLTQEAFLLHSRGEMTVSQIADALGISERTVRAKLGLTRRAGRVYDASVLFASGLREDVIAQRLGVSARTLKRISATRTSSP